MQTRNSSPPQPPVIPPLPEVSGKAQWSEADEIALIEYITEHKAEAGDGMKFKGAFWTGAAKEMLAHSSLGGVKTAAGCSSKWDRVRTKLFQANYPLTCIYPAQEVIQRRSYAQGQFIRIFLERYQGP
jgi:hypothetical protein